MNLIQAIIMGIIQGLTEFLPVSSSGHIVLASSIYKKLTGAVLASGGTEEIFFDIMIHFGTLIAILVFFRKDIKKLYFAFINAVKIKSFKDNYEAQLPLYIVLGTFATALIALPLKDSCEKLIHNPSVVGIALIVTGSLLFFTEKLTTNLLQKSDSINIKKSVLIGLAQGLALIPGISRSGSTIAAGMALGLSRVQAARYSFLLSIPVIILAVIFQVFDVNYQELINYNWLAIVVGTVVSGIVGYYCIKYFIRFISKHRLNVFAYYCWIVGLLMFIGFNLI